MHFFSSKFYWYKVNSTNLVFQNSVIALFNSTVNIYSYFEKGCQKKCMRQSQKVLWVVLSAREATDICLRVLKESNIDRIPYYLSDCCIHIFCDNISWNNCIHHYLQVFCNLVKHKESADEKISRLYIHASFISIQKYGKICTVVHGKVIFHQFQPKIATRLCDCRLERISLLVSAITKSFAFFLMKVIYKSNSNFFSCICIASDINTHGVCITVSNSPNPLVFIYAIILSA